MAWDSAISSAPRRRTTSSTLSNGAAGMHAVSHLCEPAPPDETQKYDLGFSFGKKVCNDAFGVIFSLGRRASPLICRRIAKARRRAGAQSSKGNPIELGKHVGRGPDDIAVRWR